MTPKSCTLLRLAPEARSEVDRVAALHGHTHIGAVRYLIAQGIIALSGSLTDDERLRLMRLFIPRTPATAGRVAASRVRAASKARAEAHATG